MCPRGDVGKLLIKVGFEFYLELTLDEALEFLSEKEKLLFKSVRAFVRLLAHLCLLTGVAMVKRDLDFHPETNQCIRAHNGSQKECGVAAVEAGTVRLSSGGERLLRRFSLFLTIAAKRAVGPIVFLCYRKYAFWSGKCADIKAQIQVVSRLYRRPLLNGTGTPGPLRFRLLISKSLDCCCCWNRCRLY